MTKKFSALALATLVGLAGQAAANATTIYVSAVPNNNNPGATINVSADPVTDFVNSLTEYYYNNFDGVSNGDVGVSLAYSGNGFAYTVSTTVNDEFSTMFGVNGALATTRVADNLVISFTGDKLPTAIGGDFFATSLLGNVLTTGEEDPDIVLGPGIPRPIVADIAVTLSDGSFVHVNSRSFAGISTDGAAITSVIVHYNMAVDPFPTIDNLYVGTAQSVAVPDGGATSMLLGFGLLGMAWLRRSVK